MTGSRADAGFASLVVVAGSALLLLALGAGAVVTDLVATGTRARTAADLASLAAATDAVTGSGGACARAAQVARDNRTSLRGCRVGGASGFDADVVVAVRAAGVLRAVTGLLGLPAPEVSARALAGPGR